MKDDKEHYRRVRSAVLKHFDENYKEDGNKAA
jgi:hypothetical protein